MPLFRRKAQDPPPPPEVVEITIAEVQAIERLVLHARERVEGRVTYHARTRYYPSSSQDIIASLWQRIGAASVVEQDQDQVRIPFYHYEFHHVQDAVLDIEACYGSATLAKTGRDLLNRLNALIGRARAIRDMGGTPVFDPDVARPELPSSPH